MKCAFSKERALYIYLQAKAGFSILCEALFCQQLGTLIVQGMDFVQLDLMASLGCKAFTSTCGT